MLRKIASRPDWQIALAMTLTLRIFYTTAAAALLPFLHHDPALIHSNALSTVAAFFCFWGLLRLASELATTGKVRSLLLFSVWPASFVLFAGYADSLTIALVLWAIVFGRERRWAAATACGLFAGAARPTGVLVFIPLVVMALRSRQPRSVVVLLTPLGLISYWTWLHESGRPSVVEAYRVYQGMIMVPPWRGFVAALRLIMADHDVLLAMKLILVVMVAVFCLRHQGRIEDKAFALAVILQMLMYTGRPLLGTVRYLLMVYPAFLACGAYAERWNRKQFLFCATTLGLVNLAWMWAFLNWSLVL
jgi:hypothetical protein